MANESITIYKLIILYFLKKTSIPLPQTVISDYIVSHGYTNYFTLQNALGDVKCRFYRRRRNIPFILLYADRSRQRNTGSLRQPVSAEICSEIDAYLAEHKIEIINETSLVSDYNPTDHGTYLASCSLKDGKHMMFRLEIDVPKEEDAIRVCENWEKQSETLYQLALKNLL
ncbi:MAG: DUF4364 family protein [Eubacterium sp.]